MSINAQKKQGLCRASVNSPRDEARSSVWFARTRYFSLILPVRSVSRALTYWTVESRVILLNAQVRVSDTNVPSGFETLLTRGTSDLESFPNK